MRSPLTIRAGHRDFPVRPMLSHMSHDGGCDGLFKPYEGAIYVGSYLCPQEQARVLIHEVLHAAFSAFDLDREVTGEEAIVSALDGPLAAILRDNPKLLLALSGALREGTPIV